MNIVIMIKTERETPTHRHNCKVRVKHDPKPTPNTVKPAPSEAKRQEWDASFNSEHERFVIYSNAYRRYMALQKIEGQVYAILKEPRFKYCILKYLKPGNLKDLYCEYYSSYDKVKSGVGFEASDIVYFERPLE